MQSKATTVEAYLKELPAERREVIAAVRKVMLANLGEGFQETMQYGMIGYNVPHSLYPAGYHCDPKQPLPFAGLAAQKNAYSLYLMHLYMDQAALDRFVKAWKGTGKKLDMGKSCIRFKKLEDVALDVVAAELTRIDAKKWIAVYEGALGARAKPSEGKKTVKKTAKKVAAKKVSKKVGKKA
ncbi:MAG: DUF1801 domain-containing protein [Phycisphaerales bacterium]